MKVKSKEEKKIKLKGLIGLGLVLLVLFQFFVAHPVYAQIVVGDEELSVGQILSIEPLIGYRKLSPELFTVAPREAKIGIPVDVFVASAMATPLVKDAILKAGTDPSKATLDEWYMASKVADWRISQAHLWEPTTIKVYSTGYYEDVIIDPAFVASLPQTEIFKSAKPLTYVTQVGGKEVEWLEVDSEVFTIFANSYTLLSSIAHLSPSQAQKAFTEASAYMAPFPFLAAAAEFKGGEVTFGTPIAFSSREKELVIPESITSKNDVYWIEFAVSFRDIDVSNIEKLMFRVTAPSANLALELIPLRFDKEMSVTRVVSSPELKIKFGDKAVELGKVYEQQVVYKSLKPIIVANGLQESKFSWSMTDQAVQPGAKRFVALLTVPIGKESLIVQLQASATTKSTWVAQGEIISTKPKLVDISLK